MTQDQANLLWNSIADDFEYNGYNKLAANFRATTDFAKLELAEIIRKNVVWFEGQKKKKASRSVFAQGEK